MPATPVAPVTAMNEEDFERFAEDGVFDSKTVGFLQKRYSALLQKAVDGARYLGRMSVESPAYRRAWMVWMIECMCPYKEYLELFEYLRKRGVMQYEDADLATAWGAVNAGSDVERRETAAP